MIARIAWLVFALAIHALSPGGVVRAAGPQPLVKFVSERALSFPLEAGGLGVAPASFPFLVLDGPGPGELVANVVATSLGGGTSNLPAFAASIRKPTRDQPLHALEIRAVEASHIRAGRYDITVLLWREAKPAEPPVASSTPPANPPAGAPPCTACQVETFAVTRDAVELALDDPRLVVPVPFFDRVPAAIVREAGGKSGGRLTIQSVTAQLGTAGPVLPVTAKPFGPMTLELGGSQSIRLAGAAGLPAGIWTATVRMRSDQLNTAEVTRTVTIVRKIAAWVLIAAIGIGIGVGYLMRHVLATGIRRAEVNAGATDLAARLRALGETIRDDAFGAVCASEIAKLEAAIRKEEDPGLVKTATDEAAAAVAAAETDYKAREQEELKRLTTRLDAIDDLTRRVPSLEGAFAAITTALRRRRYLVEETRVGRSMAGEGAFLDAMTETGGPEILAWAAGLKRGLADLETAWPDPPRLGEALKPAADAADVLAGKDPKDAAGWLDVVVDATRLADRTRASLRNAWLPIAQDLIGTARSLPIGEDAKAALAAAEEKLRTAAASARERGVLSDEIRDAAIGASKAVGDANRAQIGDAPPVSARGLGIPAAPGAALGGTPVLWEIGGPTSVGIGEVHHWRLLPKGAMDPAGGAPRVVWRLGSEIVETGQAVLTYRFAKAGDFSIVAEASIGGEAASSSSLVVTVLPAPILVSAASWRSRGRWMTRLQTVVLGALITVSGFYAIDGDTAGWKDVFAAFLWGFSADVTLQTLLAIKVGGRTPATTAARS